MFTWEWDDYQEKEKKIGILALDIGSNGCRLTSIAGNCKLNENEREMNTRRLIQLAELEANKLKLDCEICFGLIHSGGKISRQSRLAYICVEYTVWRVIGV